MKIELHSDEAAAREQSLGNKVSHSSRDILPIDPENFHRLVFPFVSDMVTRPCRLQLFCASSQPRTPSWAVFWEMAPNVGGQQSRGITVLILSLVIVSSWAGFTGKSWREQRVPQGKCWHCMFVCLSLCLFIGILVKQTLHPNSIKYCKNSTEFTYTDMVKKKKAKQKKLLRASDVVK